MTRRSHHSASSMPPATAGPSTAAMTGLDSSSRVGPRGPQGSLLPSVGKSSEASGLSPSRLETYFMSHPAQKAPPSPHSTATSAAGSSSKNCNAATSASALAGSIALRAWGRLWITVQTEPDFSMRTVMTPSSGLVVAKAYRAAEPESAQAEGCPGRVDKWREASGKRMLLDNPCCSPYVRLQVPRWDDSQHIRPCRG